MYCDFQTDPEYRAKKVRQICQEMLSARGYAVTSDEEEDQLLGERGDEQICVMLTPISKLDTKRIKEVIAYMSSINIKHIIVIYQHTITPTAKNIVKSHTTKIEVFKEDVLQYNPLKNDLTPQHIKLPEKDEKEFKKEFGVQFPKIIPIDPIYRFLDFREGNVIKIINKEGYVSYLIA